MDWSAVNVSLILAAWTTLALLPLGLALARWLAVTDWAGRPFIEALLLLPLLLPPTVIGFYFLVAFGQGSPLGAWLAQSLGWRLVFTMEGLLLVSVLVNLPFMVQPIQRAFAAVPHSLREAAWVLIRQLHALAGAATDADDVLKANLTGGVHSAEAAEVVAALRALHTLLLSRDGGAS